jgi:hypothetical protein
MNRYNGGGVPPLPTGERLSLDRKGLLAAVAAASQRFRVDIRALRFARVFLVVTRSGWLGGEARRGRHDTAKDRRGAGGQLNG